MDDEYVDEENLFVCFRTSVQAIRIFDREIVVTDMNLSMDLISTAHDSSDPLSVIRRRTALSKIRYWLDNHFQNSLMFTKENEWAIRAFMCNGKDDPGVENNIVLLPYEPTEEILVLILQSKLQALGGQDIILGNLSLEIDDVSGLCYTYTGAGELELPTNEEWMGTHAWFDKPWWSRNDATSTDVVALEEDDITKVPDWATSLDHLADDFISADFSAQIIRPIFRPRVIDGGQRD